MVDKDLLVKLRKQTFAGFADCKKALEASGNNLEEAVVWLRKNGIAKASNKFSEKNANEGKIFAKKDCCGAVIIELNSETDFTANSDQFSKLCNLICDEILKAKTSDIESVKNLKLSNGQIVKDEILSVSSITGEKIDLKQVSYLSKDAKTSVSAYQHHNGKIGAILKLKGEVDDEKIKQLTVHYVANAPKFLSANEVDEEWKKSERSIVENMLEKDPKAASLKEKGLYENVLEKRLEKSISEYCFLTQPYLFDGKKTVQNILDELKTSVDTAVRFEIGK